MPMPTCEDFSMSSGNCPNWSALVLLYLEDLSHVEIADIMGISVSNVGTRLGRVREKLKTLMMTMA